MDDLAIGIRAFQKGRYDDAYRRLLPFAESGIVRAQLILSRLYYAGNGVGQDIEKHQYWLQKAADNGDKSAKHQIKLLRNAN